jgi:hypothetical protein
MSEKGADMHRLGNTHKRARTPGYAGMNLLVALIMLIIGIIAHPVGKAGKATAQALA